MSAKAIKVKREYVEICQELGFKVTRTEHSKHFKVYATHPETGSREHLLVGSLTSSDHRTLRNFRASARSVVRASA